jgi:hypothetical protein
LRAAETCPQTIAQLLIDEILAVSPLVVRTCHPHRSSADMAHDTTPDAAVVLRSPIRWLRSSGANTSARKRIGTRGSVSAAIVRWKSFDKGAELGRMVFVFAKRSFGSHPWRRISLT